jgi:hypothetical protein
LVCYQTPCCVCFTAETGEKQTQPIQQNNLQPVVIVVTVAVQNTFRLEIHQNDVFYF